MTIRISSSVGGCLSALSPLRVAVACSCDVSSIARSIGACPEGGGPTVGAGGRPGRGGSHRSERREYDTPPAGGSQAKNTRCSGRSGEATATCGFRAHCRLPTVRPRGGVACPRSCGGRPPRAWRLSTASWPAVHGLCTEQPFYCMSCGWAAGSVRGHGAVASSIGVRIDGVRPSSVDPPGR